MKKSVTHRYITWSKLWIQAKGKQEGNTRGIRTLSVKISSQSVGKTVSLMRDSFGAGPNPSKVILAGKKKKQMEKEDRQV